MIASHQWEQRFIGYFENAEQTDGSHDLGHFSRVAAAAKYIASYETNSVDLAVVLAAAYFHDIVSFPKNHPNRSLSSRYAAEKAKEILAGMGFPEEKIPGVCHAIEAHSFSAQITPETIEAKITQDADRMEALGCLGIIRTFYVSGLLQRKPYDESDPLAKNRPLDDRAYALDHFYCKLFKLPGQLQTTGGRHIASKRAEFLHFFVKELLEDIQKRSGGTLEVVRACYHGGENHLKLFPDIDPLARKRALEPDLYVVDKLIQVRAKYPRFLSLFLAQLEEEITTSDRLVI
jgi:uncharacterized protein